MVIFFFNVFNLTLIKLHSNKGKSNLICKSPNWSTKEKSFKYKIPGDFVPSPYEFRGHSFKLFNQQQVAPPPPDEESDEESDEEEKKKKKSRKRKEMYTNYFHDVKDISVNGVSTEVRCLDHEFKGINVYFKKKPQNYQPPKKKRKLTHTFRK